MIVVGNERYIYKVFKRVPNSPYEWEKECSITFRGRPANQLEKKQYRIQQGVNGSSDSIFIISSNIPEGIKEKDKIVFLGKEWTVISIGYYFDSDRIVNPNIMSDEYIERRCPKGLNLQ